jgi:hypothetical protein
MLFDIVDYWLHGRIGFVQGFPACLRLPEAIGREIDFHVCKHDSLADSWLSCWLARSCNAFNSFELPFLFKFWSLNLLQRLILIILRHL